MNAAGKIAVTFFSLLGAVFCYLNATGAKLFCVTQGCRIYSGYGLFGISFYVYGLAGFLLILLLGLLHPRARTSFWLPAVLALALVLDILFLFYQYFFWPCVSCLVAGALIVLSALSALLLLRVRGRTLLWILVVAWSILGSYVGLAAVKEAAFTPWAIAGDPEAPVKVFFSPVCPACREAVTRILEDPALAAQTAFFPVAKNSEDEARIAAFLQKNEKEPSLAGLFDEAPAAPPLTSAQKWRLQVNKMALSRMGVSSVPLVIAPFLPQAASPKPGGPAEPIDSPFAPPQASPFAPPGSTPLPSATPGCSAFEESPDCETPAR